MRVRPQSQALRAALEQGGTAALLWIIAGAAVGLLAGPRIRASVFLRSTRAGEPPRRACPACSHQVLPGSLRWWPVLPVTGRCLACQIRIGPYPLLAESAAGLALADVAARATSVWELAALAWLVLLTVPLAFTDVAVHRLPDPLTAATFAGTLACFYLTLGLIRPGETGLGDATLAASIGLALGWTSWQAVFTGMFAGLAVAAVYGGVLIAAHRATRSSHLPLGPFILLGTLVAIAFLLSFVKSQAACRKEHSSS